MDIPTSTLGVAIDDFLDKIADELKQGVKLRTGNIECIEVVRSWTDNRNWQFSIIGLYECDTSRLQSSVIQSIGISKSYLQVKIDRDKKAFKMERISTSFGELQGVNEKEAKKFVEGFMESTFNRYLTEQLFKQLSEDENYQQWLIM